MSLFKLLHSPMLYILCVSLVGVIGSARAASRSEVPILYFMGKPIVEVNINGQGPFRFILDTGASSIVCDRELVKQLELPVAGKTVIGDPLNPAGVEVDMFTADLITIGDAPLQGERVLAIDLRSFMGDTPDTPVGILGVTRLRNYLTTLDFPNARLVLQSGSLPDTGNGSTLNVEIDEHDLYLLPITIGGERYQVHMDTGADQPLTMASGLATRLPLVAEPQLAGQGGLMFSTSELLTAKLSADLSLGDFSWSDLEIGMLDFPLDGNVGMGILSRFKITIDHDNSRIRFESENHSLAPVSGAPRRVMRGAPGPAGRKRYGIGFNPGEQGAVMTALGVEEGSPAAGGGVRAGDLVIKLNGVAVGDLSRQERMSAFRSSPLLLTLQRGGEELEIELSLDD